MGKLWISGSTIRLKKHTHHTKWHSKCALYPIIRPVYPHSGLWGHIQMFIELSWLIMEILKRMNWWWAVVTNLRRQPLHCSLQLNTNYLLSIQDYCLLSSDSHCIIPHNEPGVSSRWFDPWNSAFFEWPRSPLLLSGSSLKIQTEFWFKQDPWQSSRTIYLLSNTYPSFWYNGIIPAHLPYISPLSHFSAAELRSSAVRAYRCKLNLQQAESDKVESYYSDVDTQAAEVIPEGTQWLFLVSPKVNPSIICIDLKLGKKIGSHQVTWDHLHYVPPTGAKQLAAESIAPDHVRIVLLIGESLAR